MNDSLLDALFPRTWRRRVLLGGALLVLGGGALSASPLAPWALVSSRAAREAGRPQEALDAARAVLRWNPLPSTRGAARLELALDLLALGRPAEAVEALEPLCDEPGADALHLQAAQLAAELLGSPLHRHARSAALWAELARARPSDPRAGEWWLRSAQERESAGQHRAARRLRAWVATAYPALAARARLAMGRDALARGEPARAYGDYQEARRLASSASEQRLARLGMALALENLGDLPAAVAALDDPAGDDPALEIARERIERRAAASPGS